jgi:hypothetical protein
MVEEVLRRLHQSVHGSKTAREEETAIVLWLAWSSRIELQIGRGRSCEESGLDDKIIGDGFDLTAGALFI